jgi:hypothetical protein
MMKSSRAISRVNKLKLADVSGTISVPIIRASDISQFQFVDTAYSPRRFY